MQVKSYPGESHEAVLCCTVANFSSGADKTMDGVNVDDPAPFYKINCLEEENVDDQAP